MGRRRFGHEIPLDFRIPGEPEERTCSLCHVPKHCTEFYIRENGTKRTAECRPCKREATRLTGQRRAVAVRACVVAWNAANPDQVRANGHRRRARQRSNGQFAVTDRDWQRLVQRYHGRCAYCGASAALTQDHVVPISRGGAHSIGNLLPACRSCNSRKSARFLVELRWKPLPV